MQHWVNKRQNRNQRSLFFSLKAKLLWFAFYVAIALTMVGAIAFPLSAQQNTSAELSLTLPPPASHPLPDTLSRWRDPQNSGDYFDQINAAGFGYLMWSDFPIRVKINATPSNAAEGLRPILSEQQQQQWTQAIVSAVDEWSHYIPIQLVNQSAADADIQIIAQAPPLRWSSKQLFSESATTGSDASEETEHQQPSVDLPRARTAETTYSIYLDERDNGPVVMKPQCTILLSPHQSLTYLKATARHELGHALGIWGHSPVEGDVLYFSQVRTPPSISARDINTLKKIYQQPTQLGWPLVSE